MQAFERPFSISGVQAASEVSAQPMGLEETLLGAKNRVKNAKNLFPEASYWVGIEGGVGQDAHGMFAFAWIYIQDGKGTTGQAMTGTFYLPKKVADLVAGGMELGLADDQVFDEENSKQKGGSVGLLTHGKVTRRTYYAEAVKLALIPFLNPEWYS